MNAFHPDFMATHYPKFWDFSKSQQAITAEREMAKKVNTPKRVYVFVKPKRKFATL